MVRGVGICIRSIELLGDRVRIHTEAWLVQRLPRPRFPNVRRPVQLSASWTQPGRCREGPGNLHCQ